MVHWLQQFFKGPETTGGNHQLDIEHWRNVYARLSLERIERAKSLDMVSPLDLVQLEKSRLTTFQGLSVGTPAPADYFAWAHGESDKRSATKIGGTPYRSASAPWPMDPNFEQGEPMEFLAQFNFSDSRDILPNLPGDIMLVFGPCDANFPNPIVTEWVNEGIPDLVDPHRVPKPSKAKAEMIFPWVRSPVHGFRYRVNDYPELARHANSEVAFLAGRPATKIGGMPGFLQKITAPPGRFLCKLESVVAARGEQWHYVNCARPPKIRTRWSYEKPRSIAPLMIGDLGAIYFFIDGNRTVQAFNQCY